MSADSQLYEDTFVVSSMNHAKYDRVGRISALSTDGQTNITLDLNTDLYPMAAQETFQLLLASTLNLDGTKDAEGKGWKELSVGEATLADMWDYVCYGKVYRFEEGDAENMCAGQSRIVEW